ncbi:hypothetical protein CEF21_20660 [Bacillus sp. FJAT-42376]|uniref:hypothetical protein n=1 Tax=Bacillus sp. FJAT-42376 TaxID=2014076 RepID=UPI000F4D379A|nr:hypothetical protein [Bacillus sp. FJAT-42376]AZB44507.1 hypothetical protein CEF21_20660 [Bacillus sp. FJAT-42376]
MDKSYVNSMKNYRNEFKGGKEPDKNKKEKDGCSDGCLEGCSEGCCSFNGCMPLIMIPVQIAVLGYLLLDKII